MNIYNAILEGYEPEVYCTECGQECSEVWESFDYAGTHCTHGKSGTHYTGYKISSCCGAPTTWDKDYEEEDPCHPERPIR